MSDWGSRPQGPEAKAPGTEGTDEEAEPVCPWCSAKAPAGAIHCPACSASLAERESLGGIAIPGVTEVDPDLIEERPYPMIKTFSTQRGGSITIMGRPPSPPEPKPDPATLGQPSQAALEMRDRLEGEGMTGAGDEAGTAADPNRAKGLAGGRQRRQSRRSE
jgi:hypothetical protein